MRIILASTSPRRIDLLKTVGLTFDCLSPQCEEVIKKGESPSAMVKRLASEKALSVVGILNEEQIDQSLIIASDTTVVAPDGKRILGKPKDFNDAVRILGIIAGKTHTVLTAYALLPIHQGLPGKPLIRVVKSRVTLKPLTPAQRKSYVQTGEPLDKAGAYAAQGLGMALVEKLSGSYSNVVGLPMAQLTDDLEKKFKISFLKSK